ncbi:hypothetical protein LA080_001070 [Diaporthe eres]|uniref:Altered inheritance of mitochondria protein 21 n=1 Tax=Diaporthe vaccinii TaxID=105482 RepID=A0ABR4E4U3_9PEZI|nr:hypothetical protein LA080_001070 [Diaporthe eres]
MSTAATQQQPPAIPPRPSRGSQDKDSSELPRIPPRPVKRGPSPNPDRYAPSPLNGGLLSPTKKDQRSNSNGDPIERSRSVDLPAVVGEEGMEYAALAQEVASSREPSTSPTQTRTVDQNMKIYAPTATMPASRAKQRIMQVTRTDSDNAAAFGIGKPSQEIPTPSNRSLKKKASTASGLSHSEVEDEEHGIPEIGQQIPLLPHAGDVQAPSPAPGAETVKSHKRKASSRGLPPGSYGLHGHNVAPQDKLEKEYYNKHPELLKLEHHPYQADRPTDFALSSEQLNKLVRETEATGQGVGTHEHVGLPSEQAGWAALDASSRPQSVKPGEKEVHIEEPNRRRSILLSGDPVPAPLPEEGTEYTAPILAEDEVRKNTPQRDQVACIEPSRERRGSDFEADPPRSRPASRPASLYKVDSSDMRSTPLEDVEEYEPLFPEDDEGTPKKHLTAAQIEKIKQRFPSKDIWEDAPNSVHHTATVSTPDLTEQIQKSIPPREQTETPAQEWARKQEELAEKELTHPDAFLWRNQKPTWVGHQPHLSQETSRPKMAQKFPSRDVWEDTPDSLKLETTVSGPQMEPASPADTKPPHVPERPRRKSSGSRDKPAVPERPKSKSPEETSKPQIPDRPKPQIPARPAKASAAAATPSDAPAPKVKPAVPARPAGNKIAALQAGFMSDLNKKLGLGPRVSQPKEESKDEVPEEPKEKKPLTDARKGRARGPQRRAPAAATAAAVAPSESAAKKPKLSFSTTVTIWSLDPESEGTIQVGGLSPTEEKQEPSVPAAKATEVAAEKSAAPAVEASTDDKPVVDEAEPSVKSETGPKLEENTGVFVEDKKEEEPKVTKQETLATNMAGESVEEAVVEEDEAGKVKAKHAEVNPVED